MSWQLGRYPYHQYYLERGGFPSSSGMVNEQCFIRKEHKCGKMLGASKSCFIACPSDSKLETVLALMSEKLTKLGIEPIIAIKERAYGQDIFCTKICGKIIESRFCIVILDDTVKKSVFIPNPNVYYEYGLMTSLRKHIIPLQKEKLKLAFNIQSHDTIKYNHVNINAELERGIREAIKFSEAREPEKARGDQLERAILRKMELAGFAEKGDRWFLSDVIADTIFKGFGHEANGYFAYIGKIDNQNDIQTCLDDLDIVIYRTEHKINNLKAELDANKKQRDLFRKKQSKIGIDDLPGVAVGIPASERIEYQRFSRGLREIDDKITETIDRINLMEVFYIGFIVTPDLAITKFMDLANKKIEPYPRYRIVYTQDGRIQLGDVCVNYIESHS